MKFEGITPQGMRILLGRPIAVRISQAVDAPADDLTGEFPWQKLPPLFRLHVEQNGKTIFYGIVDEQTEQFSEQGAVLRLTARSLAALLLDNQALPQTYYSPPFSTIFSRHTAPYGLTQYRVPDGQKRIGELTVTKGMSEWQVLELFCRLAWNTVPMIGPNQVLTVTPENRQDTILFSHSGQGISYSSFTKKQKNYERISQIRLQSARNGNYEGCVSDTEAMRNGVQRRRCFSAFSAAGLGAEQILQRSRQKAWEWVLQVPGWPRLSPGMYVRLENPYLGVQEGLQIWSVNRILDADGMFCSVILRRAYS
ncbi:hypothetical protein [Clostridium minihomine]|uniref:hypothetical protein n=1 Tax=Clostridium minihomine TaxID=2045012 RepID=UPI000C779515|nr:hypothetical protein [Clostridium minihomine]